MNGAWHLYRRGERWRKPRRSAWLALGSERAEAVMFGGSELELLKRSRLRSHPRLARLGPDILGPEFTVGRGVEALRAQRPDRELGEALLDQSALAGIGNIYKSEGCFAAGLDPWRAIGDLGDAELAEVVEKTRDLMAAAVESGRQPKRIYRRAGGPCPRCRTPISSRAQGDDARVTYWCPACQR
jgi:endonuclease-8